MIKFPCWACEKMLKTAEEHAGKKCKCNKCGKENTIPSTPSPKVVDYEEDELAEPILAPSHNSKFTKLTGIGIGAIIVIALFTLNGLTSKVERPATFRDVLEMNDAAITRMLDNMKLNDLEEFEHDWINYLFDQVKGETNTIRASRVYTMIKDALGRKGSRGILNQLEDLPGPFPLKKDPIEEKAMNDAIDQRNRDGLWGEKGPPTNRKK